LTSCKYKLGTELFFCFPNTPYQLDFRVGSKNLISKNFELPIFDWYKRDFNLINVNDFISRKCYDNLLMIYKLNDTKKKGLLYHDVYTIILLRDRALESFIISYLLIVDHDTPGRSHALPMSKKKNTNIGNKN